MAEAAPDAALHGELDALIRRHLPGVTASVLARPAADVERGFVDWYSDLAGQPVALAALAEDARAEVRALLADRLESLSALAERLRPVEPAAAERLRAALSFPGEETVYVVGGQPVIAFWGHRPLAEPAASEPLPAPPSEPPAAVATAPAGTGRRGLWLALALLLLAAGGAGLFAVAALPWPPWGPDVAALLAAAKEEEAVLNRRLAALAAGLNEELARCAAQRALLAARDDEARLQTALAAAQARLSEELAACPLKDELRRLAAHGEDLAHRLGQIAATLHATLNECQRVAEEERRKAAEEQEKTAKKRQDAATARAAGTPPSPRPDALAPCPGERSPEQAPDVAIVLDASGSMGLSANASKAEIQRQLRSLGGLFGLGALVFGDVSGPTRLDEAKKGVSNVVRSLPDDVDVGLVTLQHCPQATKHGFYSGAQRGALYSKVAGLRPMQGTPLAQGLLDAGEMVDGVEAAAVLVVISDGEDSCGQDPCAAARRLKERKPQIKINVVDIVGDGAANCLATVTGGRILRPEDGLSFERMIKKAAEEALKPPHCP